MAIFFCATSSARAASTPTEWCATASVGSVVYFDYCGVYAHWHIDRFDLRTDQWLAAIPTAPHIGFFAGAPGILLASYEGVTRYDLDGTHPYTLPDALAGATSIDVDGRFAFLGDYHRLQSYDLLLHRPIGQPDNGFGYDQPHPFIVDTVHSQLLGQTDVVSPRSPVSYPYDTNGALQYVDNNRYNLPFTSGPRNYLAPDASTFVNSGGSIFTTDTKYAVGTLGGPFDAMVFAGADLVVLRYDTLVRIDSTYRELGRFTLDQPYSDLAVDGGDVVAFNNRSGVVHSRRVPIESILPQLPATTADPTALPFVATKIQLDGMGVLYLLVGGEARAIHRYDLAGNVFLAPISLPEAATTFAIDPVSQRGFVGYTSASIGTIDPGATQARALHYTRLPLDEMSVADGRLFTAEPDYNYDVHAVRDPSTGAELSWVDTRTTSLELVWSPANRRIYYIAQNLSPNNVFWDDVSPAGIIVGYGQSNYFGAPLQAIPPVRVDPTGSYLVLGSGQTMDTATMQLRTQTLPDTPTDATWIGTTLFAAIAASSDRSIVRRYMPDLTAAASARLLGIPRRLYTYAGALVLVSEWNGETLITRIPADFSGSDCSVVPYTLTTPIAQGAAATVSFEFRNQGPADAAAVHVTIASASPVGAIAWTCQTETGTVACGSGPGFDALPSIAAGSWLRVSGTFPAPAAAANTLVFSAAIATAPGSDPVAWNNAATDHVKLDSLFKARFE